MNNKKTFLSTFIALIFTSGLAQAELKPLEDKELSEIEGQSGITIDLEFKLQIGELVWKDEDQGSLIVQGIRIGGHGLKKDK